MMRLLCAAGAVGLCLLAGCREAGSEKEGLAGREPDAVIGVSVLTFANPFFQELAGAVEEEAAGHGYAVIVVDGAEDAVKQDQQVDDFITKQVDAIVLCPCDSKAVGASIVKANRAGIPVFTADIASLADQGEVVCHVATDNLGGGRKAAEAVIEMLDGRGKVAVLDYPLVESVIMRTTGFKEVIAEAPGIEVVGYWPGGGERKRSSSAAEDILQSHPDLAGFFCVNDPSAMGAINAIEKANRVDQIKVVGFDAQPEARRAVRDGKLYATIVQYPKKIGSTVADAVHRHLVGRKVDPEILIEVAIYRKANADIDATLKDEE